MFCIMFIADNDYINLSKKELTILNGVAQTHFSEMDTIYKNNLNPKFDYHGKLYLLSEIDRADAEFVMKRIELRNYHESKNLGKLIFNGSVLFESNKV